MSDIIVPPEYRMWYHTTIDIRIKIEDDRLGKEFPLPEFATEGSSAIDLRAMVTEPTVIDIDERKLIPTGIRIEIPEGIGMFLLPRSGLGSKQGVVLGNLVGLIDSDYRGVVLLSIWNSGDEPFTVSPGERLAQACFMPTLRAKFEIVSELSDTSRGEGGFGHTGL